MPENFRRSLCWIRRDLRLEDNAALSAATQSSESVGVVFVFDTTILGRLEDRNDRRVSFIHGSLAELDGDLRGNGSRLIVLYGDPVEEIPKLAQKMQAEAVFTARDYEPDAIARDQAVELGLAEIGVALRTVKDSVVFEAGEILTKEGRPFRIYTPYSRAWRSRFAEAKHAPQMISNLARLAKLPLGGDGDELGDFSLKRLGFDEVDLWISPGEASGRHRLREFAKRLESYAEDRNYPAKEATSGLSVHLRFGTVGIRQCVRTAVGAGAAGDAWLGELIWRDFFQDVLAHHPQVVSHPFQSRFEGVEYPGLEEHFQAWCSGQTGYPLVDAAMRHFLATGWMHNRLRMVCASFLTKDLLVDYRRGEAFFARYLLDFDLASNNGNWQWAASTGCDAQPYFRVFNPVAQSEKFDSEGAFIRSVLPELSDLTPPAVHFPSRASSFDLSCAGIRLGTDYPAPIVDHAVQRERAIRLFSRVTS